MICSECPRFANQPATHEGRQFWELIRRSQNQLRIIDGAVIGFDFGAILALADATGVNRAAVGEWLPNVEAVAVTKMNERMKEQTSG